MRTGTSELTERVSEDVGDEGFAESAATTGDFSRSDIAKDLRSLTQGVMGKERYRLCFVMLCEGRGRCICVTRTVLVGATFLAPV